MTSSKDVLDHEIENVKKLGFRIKTNTAVGKDVTILYRRTRAEMPAATEEVDEVEREGIEIRFLVAPVRMLVENGRLKGLDCIRMQLGEVDGTGRRRPVPIDDSEFTVEIDALIPAIGQQSDIAALADDAGLTVSRSGTIQVDPETLYTGVDGVLPAETSSGDRTRSEISRKCNWGSLPKWRLQRPGVASDVTKGDAECQTRNAECGMMVDSLSGGNRNAGRSQASRVVQLPGRGQPGRPHRHRASANLAAPSWNFCWPKPRTRLRAYPKTVGDWLILRSLRSKMCLSPSPQTVFG